MRRDYKVPFCACTNGDVWKVFDVLNQNQVLQTQISRDGAADCALKLLALWRTSLIDGSLRAPVTLLSKEPAESADQVDHHLSEVEELVDGHAWTLANLNADDGEPSRITFPGEGTQVLHTQKDLLVSVVNYLVRTGSLTTENATFSSGRKRYIVHSSPRHPTNKHFKSPVKIADGLYLETSNPFSQTIKYAQDLLKHYRHEAGLAGRVRLGR